MTTLPVTGLSDGDVDKGIKEGYGQIMVDTIRFRRLLEKQVGDSIDHKWESLVRAVTNRNKTWFTTLNNKLEIHLFMLRLDEIHHVNYRIYRLKAVTKPSAWLVVIELEYNEA